MIQFLIKLVLESHVNSGKKLPLWLQRRIEKDPILKHHHATYEYMLKRLRSDAMDISLQRVEVAKNSEATTELSLVQRPVVPSLNHRRMLLAVAASVFVCLCMLGLLVQNQKVKQESHRESMRLVYLATRSMIGEGERVVSQLNGAAKATTDSVMEELGDSVGDMTWLKKWLSVAAEQPASLKDEKMDDAL